MYTEILAHVFEGFITHSIRAMDYRLVTSMQFGIPLVLDMDYSAYMRQQERSNTAEQIQDLYSINKADEAIPFHLHFTSCPENNPVFR